MGKKKGKYLDSELRKMARMQLQLKPGSYWEFLESMREDVTEEQMIMLLDIQETYWSARSKLGMEIR
jgi:hypothetical protein